MRRYVALTGLNLTLCALACAQQMTGDRVVVPARNTSQPRKLVLSVTNGSITVKTHSGQDVIVESGREDGDRQRPDRRADGLRRLYFPRGLTVEEQNNVITVHLSDSSNGSAIVTVPVETSLDLKSTNGTIDVDGVHGELVVSSHNAPVTMNHVSGTVMADSHNGAVTVTMDRVDPGKPISFSSWNGSIDVTLPADVKANLKLKSSDNGEVWSDFDVKLAPGQTIAEKNNTPDGKYRVRTDRTITGTINGGGSTDASFTTWNGSIYIRKKK